MKPGTSVLFALILLGAISAMQPWLWGSVFNAVASFRDRQTQQVQLASVKQLTEDIRRVDGPAQALLDQAAVAYPPAAAAPQIVERLEAVAAAHDLALQLVSIVEASPHSKDPALTPFEVNLIVVGSPRPLLTFFEAVEHMQEFASVEHWEIKSQAPGYSATMNVIFFLQPG